MSEEEKEAIDKLKRSANYFVMPIYETTIILNLIEKQQKEIENLKEINKEHQKLNGELRDEIKRQGNTREIEEKYIEENFISKDKIREKIKELEENVKEFEEYWSRDPRKFKRAKSIDFYKLEALQELLEGNNEK